MAKKVFEIEWDDNLGIDWMNIFNLELCLFSDNHIILTNKEVLKVRELPAQEESCKDYTELRNALFMVEGGRLDPSVALERLQKLYTPINPKPKKIQELEKYSDFMRRPIEERISYLYTFLAELIRHINKEIK